MPSGKTRESRGSPTGDVIAVSGGPDSVYLFHKKKKTDGKTVLAHLDHAARGRDSDEDRNFVAKLALESRVPLEASTVGPALRGYLRGTRAHGKSGRTAGADKATGFEERSRNERYAFLKAAKEIRGARRVLVAHTADDQVETVLMRILKGAGISGLKGIPRKTNDGIERPLLDTWREDILAYLTAHGIPYRVDKSNFDTRIERNWIRHVLIPLLESRYGKPVKKRIFALGERFREIDEFLEEEARRWTARNVKGGKKDPEGMGDRFASVRVDFPRKRFSKVPGALGKKILQRICYERFGVAPNERLLAAMAAMIGSGGPSSRMDVGKGVSLRCGYEEASFLPRGGNPRRAQTRGKGPVPDGGKGKRRAPAEPWSPVRLDGPGRYAVPFGMPGEEPGNEGRLFVIWREKERIDAAGLKKLSKGELAAAFDAGKVSSFLTIRPLRKGDRIRPFGGDAGKRVKEILIDRKVPRDKRWGRPAVCDEEGRILWIPGVLRSAHGIVTPGTRKTTILKLLRRPGGPPNVGLQRKPSMLHSS